MSEIPYLDVAGLVADAKHVRRPHHGPDEQVAREFATKFPATFLTLVEDLRAHFAAEAEALIAPLAAVGAELVRAEAGEEWKAEIPDDKAIFAFCGKVITAGQLRAAATFVSRPAEQRA